MHGCSVCNKYRGFGIQDYFLKLRERYASRLGKDRLFFKKEI